MVNEVWYRYKDDVNGVIVEHEYEVRKHTPVGVWLNVDGKDRWAKKDTLRPFAAPDKNDALESYMARKFKQRLILREQMDRVEKAILSGQAVKSGLRKPRSEGFLLQSDINILRTGLSHHAQT